MCLLVCLETLTLRINAKFFCCSWRHHTNPVGTEWKWQMDEPEGIVEEAVTYHTKMINEFKGVNGVIPERLKEGMSPQHCALSLVGEPIMYPKINQLIGLLHSRSISTFLVTNVSDRLIDTANVLMICVIAGSVSGRHQDASPSNSTLRVN